MAIKIIKHGKPKFRAICPVCGCEFEYEYEDLFDSSIPELKQITCPDCGEWLTHQKVEFVKNITWNNPNWPDCETCPNKPDPNKIIVGDIPCTYCKKLQTYCTSCK